MEKNMKTFALAGNPNCGKTTLFNSLTGSTAYVGNWPGVTVEKRTGVYKNKRVGSAAIVDLPGIYSLSPYTPEEVISRNYILDEKPDCVINVIDATNLERNLYMTTQILEMDVPVVIALNMMDAVTKSGQRIDAESLSKALGVPVVKISALHYQGLDELMRVALLVARKSRVGQSILSESSYAKSIADAKGAYEKAAIGNPLFHSIKALENDEIENKLHPEESKAARSYFDEKKGDFEAISADERYRYIASHYSIYQQGAPAEEKKKLSISDRIDKVLTNKWVGIPIFLVILFIVFHITFAPDLFYMHAMGLNTGTFAEGTMWEGLFYDDGVASIGVFLSNFVNCLTRAFTDWVRGLLVASAGENSWVVGFVSDGVLGGLFAVIGFLPQILLLFFFFSLLEDSGYMARVAFILDRVFRRFGLSGRAFLPMIMGFGCSVPAMINTRTLNTEQERTQTIRVIPFFACSAKLTIITAVAGAISNSLHYGDAGIITLCMYLLGMVSAIAMVLFMHHTTQRAKIPPFIMELPAYHVPQPHALAVHLWDKAKYFVRKAFTVILLSTIAIWFLSHFSWNWSYLADEDIAQSMLASLGMLIAPIFTPLGFGSQLNSTGWVFSVASIAGMVAKESVVGTFGTLAGALGQAGLEGSEAVAAMIAATGVTKAGLLAFMAFNILNIPCFASVATAKAELKKGTLKWTILFWLVTSYVIASFVYLAFAWPWTLGIILPLIVLFFAGAYLYDRHKNRLAFEKGEEVAE